MKNLIIVFCALFIVFGCTVKVSAQDKLSAPVLFTNVDVWDGTSDELATSTDVLVVSNKISKIGKGLAQPDGTEVIDGGGRTLIPGLTDAHVHLMPDDQRSSLYIYI
jgi:imidazolonepropionase-like amidohydrolase